MEKDRKVFLGEKKKSRLGDCWTHEKERGGITGVFSFLTYGLSALFKEANIQLIILILLMKSKICISEEDPIFL